MYRFCNAKTGASSSLYTVDYKQGKWKSLKGGEDDVYTILKAAQSHTLCVSNNNNNNNNNNTKYNYAIMHDSERAVCGGDT